MGIGPDPGDPFWKLAKSCSFGHWVVRISAGPLEKQQVPGNGRCSAGTESAWCYRHFHPLLSSAVIQPCQWLPAESQPWMRASGKERFGTYFHAWCFAWSACLFVCLHFCLSTTRKNKQRYRRWNKGGLHLSFSQSAISALENFVPWVLDTLEGTTWKGLFRGGIVR